MNDKAPAKTEDAAPPPKKGLPVKTIAAVLVMLVVEAGVILGAVMMFGKPSEVRGVGIEQAKSDEGDVLVEIPVLKEKFANNASGRVWVWDTEIVIVSKAKHAGPEPSADAKDDTAKDAKKGPHVLTVREELRSRMAQVRTGIGAIFSSAQHSYFTEPGRETLSRQVLEYLRAVFGQDAEGNERIQGVLIPKCLGFPADY